MLKAIKLMDKLKLERNGFFQQRYHPLCIIPDASASSIKGIKEDCGASLVIMQVVRLTITSMKENCIIKMRGSGFINTAGILHLYFTRQMTSTQKNWHLHCTSMSLKMEINSRLFIDCQIVGLDYMNGLLIKTKVLVFNQLQLGFDFQHRNLLRTTSQSLQPTHLARLS